MKDATPLNYKELPDYVLAYIAHIDKLAWRELRDRDNQQELHKRNR